MSPGGAQVHGGPEGTPGGPPALAEWRAIGRQRRAELTLGTAAAGVLEAHDAMLWETRFKNGPL